MSSKTPMKNSELIQHLKSIARAFFFYGRGPLYLYMRYFVAPRLLSRKELLQRPITRDDLSMHIMFGAKDFLMALWSLASFYRVMPEVGELVIHSDGTLKEKHLDVIRRLFPSARIEDTRDFMPKHASALQGYPVLKKFREEYPRFQSKKLLDQYFTSGKPLRLILDSDLLWFKEPTELVQSIRSGVPKPLMMSNQDARIHVAFKDGKQTSDEVARANSGVVLYRDSQFSLAEVEAYVANTDYMGRKFTDQACFATVLKPDILSDSTYIIKGTLTGSVIMRHYTQPQREKFFLYGLDHIWKDIVGFTRPNF